MFFINVIIKQIIKKEEIKDYYQAVISEMKKHYYKEDGGAFLTTKIIHKSIIMVQKFQRA